MSSGSGISWLNPLSKNTVEMGVKLNAAIGALFAYEATNIEGDMRTNAPWTDQTGNARNGLFARAGTEESKAGERGPGGQFKKVGTYHVINLFHTMPYGIYLETRFSGRYAIIVPTLQAKAPEVMEGTRKIMAKLGVGGGIV